MHCIGFLRIFNYTMDVKGEGIQHMLATSTFLLFLLPCPRTGYIHRVLTLWMIVWRRTGSFYFGIPDLESISLLGAVKWNVNKVLLIKEKKYPLNHKSHYSSGSRRVKRLARNAEVWTARPIMPKGLRSDAWLANPGEACSAPRESRLRAQRWRVASGYGGRGGGARGFAPSRHS